MSYSDYWRRKFLAEHPEYEQQSQELRYESEELSPSVRAAPLPWLARVNTAPELNCSFPLSGAASSNFELSEIFLQKRIKTCHGVTPDSRLTEYACRLRQRLKLTQQELAARLGISVRTIQDWEQGRRQPHGSGRALLRQWIDQHDHQC